MAISKKPLIALGGLLLIIAVFIGAWFAQQKPPVSGDKVITVQVVHGDQKAKDFVIATYAGYLGEALQEQEGLVSGEQGPYGLYIHTVDGESDQAGDKTWWCLTKDGAEVTTSVDQTLIKNGDHFELTLKTGY